MILEECDLTNPFICFHFANANAAILIGDLTVPLRLIAIECSFPNLTLLVSESTFTVCLTPAVDATGVDAFASTYLSLNSP